jgi:NAD(P)-dependent dehydrogenase (short-subunit alcohol dehydrogenase family)
MAMRAPWTGQRPSHQPLAGKVALVTGASRGIGEYIAVELAKTGADVIVAARSETQPHEKLPGTIYTTAEQVEQQGRRALPVRADLTSDDDIQALADTALKNFGRVDILVNNAAILFPGKFHELPFKRFDLTYRLVLRAPALLTHLLLPAMIERGAGTVINLSSISADQSGAGDVAYAMWKIALRKMAEGIAEENKDTGVTAFSLSPVEGVATPGLLFWNPIETIPPETLEPPDLIGRAAVFLCTDRAKPYSGRHFYTKDLLNGPARGF